MSDSDTMPDGVQRMQTFGAFLAPASYDGNDGKPITVVEGHGRVREMYLVTIIDEVFNTLEEAATVWKARGDGEVRRVIVIECDAAQL